MPIWCHRNRISIWQYQSRSDGWIAVRIATCSVLRGEIISFCTVYFAKMMGSCFTLAIALSKSVVKRYQARPGTSYNIVGPFPQPISSPKFETVTDSVKSDLWLHGARREYCRGMRRLPIGTQNYERRKGCAWSSMGTLQWCRYKKHFFPQAYFFWTFTIGLLTDEPIFCGKSISPGWRVTLHLKRIFKFLTFNLKIKAI